MLTTLPPVPAPAQRTWRNSSRLRENFTLQWNGCWVHFGSADDVRAEVGDAEEFEASFGLPVTDERADAEVAKMPQRLVDKIEDALDAYRVDGE